VILDENSKPTQPAKSQHDSTPSNQASTRWFLQLDGVNRQYSWGNFPSFALSDSSCSFNIFSFFFYLQNLQNQIFIPLENNLHKIFLGPMGNPDPSRAIIAETNKTRSSSLLHKELAIHHPRLEGLLDQGISQEKNRLGSSQFRLVYLLISFWHQEERVHAQRCLFFLVQHI